MISEYSRTEKILDEYMILKKQKVKALVVESLSMNPNTYRSVQSLCHDSMDFITVEVLKEQNIMGSLWGAMVLLDPDIPAGEVHLLGELRNEKTYRVLRVRVGS